MNFNPNQWPTADSNNNNEDPLVKELGISDEDINNDPIKKQRVEEIKKFLTEIPEQNKTYDTPISSTFKGQLQISKEDFTEEYRTLRDVLKDKIVVDLACGEMGYVLNVMKDLGVKGYIGVDILLPTEDKIKRLKEENKGPEISYIKDDMLLFLAKLPDKSVNLVINGIDDIIITSDKYWEKLKEQMQRVTEEDGIITGVGFSERMNNILPGFIDVSLHDEDSFKIRILKKNNFEAENEISKKRELTEFEVSKKAQELGVAETYLDGAQIIKKRDGSSEIKLHLNNFWYKIYNNQVNDLKKEYEEMKKNLDNELKEWDEKLKENKLAYSGLESPNILRERIKNHEIAIEKWQEFENENKDLVEKIKELNIKKKNLAKKAFSTGKNDDFNKLIRFNNENDKFYEQAYLILAKKGVARNILRG